MEPSDFEMGDEPIDVERNPEGARMTVCISLDPVDAFNVLARADFYKIGVVEYVKRLAVEDARSTVFQFTTR
jgi:hypothetical protein